MPIIISRDFRHASLFLSPIHDLSRVPPSPHMLKSATSTTELAQWRDAGDHY
jgi:hypothetical protein